MAVAVQQGRRQPRRGHLQGALSTLPQPLGLPVQRGWDDRLRLLHADFRPRGHVDQRADVAQMFAGSFQRADSVVLPECAVDSGQGAHQVGDLFAGDRGGRGNELGAAGFGDVLDHHDGSPRRVVIATPVACVSPSSTSQAPIRILWVKLVEVLVKNAGRRRCTARAARSASRCPHCHPGWKTTPRRLPGLAAQRLGQPLRRQCHPVAGHLSTRARHQARGLLGDNMTTHRCCPPRPTTTSTPQRNLLAVQCVRQRAPERRRCARVSALPT